MSQSFLPFSPSLFNLFMHFHAIIIFFTVASETYKIIVSIFVRSWSLVVKFTIKVFLYAISIGCLCPNTGVWKQCFVYVLFARFMPFRWCYHACSLLYKLFCFWWKLTGSLFISLYRLFQKQLHYYHTELIVDLLNVSIFSLDNWVAILVARQLCCQGL